MDNTLVSEVITKNTTVDYKKKYLKYKLKYQQLKNQLAGTSYFNRAATSLKSATKNATQYASSSAKCLFLQNEYKNNSQAKAGCALEKASKLKCTWTNNANPVTNSSGVILGCHSCPNCNY